MEKNRIKLIVIANILAVILLILILLLVKYNNDLKIEETNKNIQKEEIKTINIDSEIVKKLNKYILKFNILEEKNFYQNKKTTVKDFSNETILTDIFFNVIDVRKEAYKKEIDKENIEVEYYYFTKDYVDSKIKEVFGDNVEVTLSKKLIFPGTALNFENNEYVFIFFPGGGGSSWSGDATLVKAEEKGDEIYLYDRYIHTVDEYKNSNMENGYYNASDRGKLISTKFEDVLEKPEIFDEYQDIYTYKVIAGNIFKHTFKKNTNGTYHWESTEIVE